MSGHLGAAALQRYALEEMDADERLRIDAHLLHCAACAARVEREQRLDAWIVATGASRPPPGALRSTLDAVWAAVDAGGDAPRAAATPARARGPWPRRWGWAAGVAAALLVVAVLARPDAGPATAEVATSAAPAADATSASPADATVPADAAVAAAPPGDASAAVPVELPRLDEARRAGLERARERVARLLLEADAHAPVDDVLFVSVVERDLEPLRGEGWALGSILRAHALGEDADLSLAALRLCARDPSLRGVLARALERPHLQEACLERLALRPVDLDPVPAVVRELERLALAPRADALARRAFAALAAAPGREAARAADRVLARLVDRARHDPADLERALAAIARAEPARAWDALLALAGAHPERARAVALARDDVGVLVERLGTLEDEARAARALAWSRRLAQTDPDAGRALDRALAARLARRPGETLAATALGERGGPLAARALFDAWRAGGEVALGPLLALLPDDAPARRALGASVAKAPGLGEPEAFVRLAERLPAPSGSALLADAVVSADAAPSAPRLLRALASSGGAAEAPRLLAWLAARPGDPPLRALAWTVCARLDEAATLARWSASGRPADVLRDAARDVAWRRDADALDRVRAALHPPAPVARGGLGPGAVVVRRPAPEPRSQRPPEVP